jgi:hypothetical protein
MNFAMKTKTLNSAQLLEYALVLEPGVFINKAIREEIEKEQLIPSKNSYEILLGSFQAKEELENTIVRWLQRIFNLQGSFVVTLNNFSGRPPHNIHLRIQDPEEIKKMINQLKMIDHFIQTNDCPPAVLCYTPQMEISNNIPENSFYKILNEFSGKSFHESFVADKIKLYKRSQFESSFQLTYSFSLPPGSKY